MAMLHRLPAPVRTICELRGLQKLKIKCEHLSSDSLLCLAESGARLASLRALCLQFHKRAGHNHAMARVLEAFQPRLQLLHLFWTGGHEWRLGAHLCHRLAQCHDLRNLKLHLLMLDGDALDTLRSLPHLRRLHLAVSSEWRSCSPPVAGAFQCLVGLRHVTLKEWARLRDQDVRALCVASGQCLEVFRVSGSPELTDAAVVCVLARCPRLLHLKLCRCPGIRGVRLLEDLAREPVQLAPRLLHLTLVYLCEEDSVHKARLLAAKRCKAARPRLQLKMYG